MKDHNSSPQMFIEDADMPLTIVFSIAEAAADRFGRRNTALLYFLIRQVSSD